MPLGTFLNGSEPARLRGLLWLALSDVCQVGTLTATDDGGGGATSSWSYGADVPCRIDPITGNESLAAERISDRSTHLVTLPPGTMVTTSSRLAINGLGTFEVTAVQLQTAAMAQLVEVVQVT